MTPKDLTQSIKTKALEIGFDLVGITDANPHGDRAFFEAWLYKGYHGSMAWMDRGREKRLNPDLVLPGAKSFICCGLNYYRGHPKSTEVEDSERGWISNYAWGDDYHDVVLEKLKRLETHIRTLSPSCSLKSYVDTGPILERSYAASAGLGWIGKNTLLINRKIGSYFFISEIVTDLELISDGPETNHCGTCTRCLDVCPTQALSPYELNSNRCLSYLTIEHKGEIDVSLQPAMGHQIYGCDICQDVCPWNRKAPVSQEESFDPRPGNFYPVVQDVLTMTVDQFRENFRKNPVKRAKLEGLQRNANIAKQNQKRD